VRYSVHVRLSGKPVLTRAEARALMPPAACKICLNECRLCGKAVPLCPRCSGGNDWVQSEVVRRAIEQRIGNLLKGRAFVCLVAPDTADKPPDVYTLGMSIEDMRTLVRYLSVSPTNISREMEPPK
jgi:hypothetical protein